MKNNARLKGCRETETEGRPLSKTSACVGVSDRAGLFGGWRPHLHMFQVAIRTTRQTSSTERCEYIVRPCPQTNQGTTPEKPHVEMCTVFTPISAQEAEASPVAFSHDPQMWLKGVE